MNDDANGWADSERDKELERQQRLKPEGEPEKLPEDVSGHITIDGTGILDTDLLHEFIRDNGYMFCMDDSTRGSELHVFSRKRLMWRNIFVREKVHDLAKDVVNRHKLRLIEVQDEINSLGVTPERRQALAPLETSLMGLVKRCGKANTVRDIASMAYQHLVSTLVEKPVTLNANPLLLNCENGVVDLNTGKMRHRKRTDYITKSTGTWYDPDVDYSWFEEAVRKIFDGNEEIYEFVHKWFGYSVTGLRRDHALLILFGKGRNGKSLLIDALATALGAYAFKLPRGFMEIKKFGTDNNDLYALAGLNGARFAHGSETGEHADLKPEVIKAITGDDSITARHSHKDLKTFTITHKITLATNYKPKVPADDDAIWARLFLTPTPARFGPEDEVILGEAKYVWDQKLLEKCKTPEGRSAVLRWAVAGAPKYLAEGLVVPQSIRNQIALHRRDMDDVGAFVQEVSVHMQPVETNELEELTGGGGTEEKREKWKAMTSLQRCQIDRGVFFKMYLAWCKSQGITHAKTQRHLSLYLKENIRMWSDEFDGQLKMPPMKEKKTPKGSYVWRWVKLSQHGERLLDEVRGGTQHDLDNKF
jgi:P4 family phage/plasmid primase-like protien